jgi:hypothetical protein
LIKLTSKANGAPLVRKLWKLEDLLKLVRITYVNYSFAYWERIRGLEDRRPKMENPGKKTGYIRQEICDGCRTTKDL